MATNCYAVVIDGQKPEGRAAPGQLPDEEWRPVVGFESSHEVSSLGRVRGIARVIRYKDGRSRWTNGRILRGTTDSYGHTQYGLSE